LPNAAAAALGSAAMHLPLTLDQSANQSLTAQLAGQLRDAISRGRIARGAKLPSSRRLSEQLGVSRNTVMRAYDDLRSEGYIEARPASCVAVATCLPESMLLAADATQEPHHDGGAQMPAPASPWCPRDLFNRHRHRLPFDFFPGRPNAGLFPIKTWRRLMQNCLSHGGAVGLAQYGDPAGSMTLRGAIANHLAMTRGIVAEPSRIIIVSGVQEGITVAARLFVRPGAVAVVENPGYQGAVYGLRAAGAEVVGVAVDEQGLNTADLPAAAAALAYVTPSHQFPVGGTLPPARRERLITWARRHGCYILEDDYDCDVRYQGSPLPAIAAMAPDCTIYLGSFSNSLGAGLRLGYMVVPGPIADAARTAKTLINNGNSWLDQAVLGEMMRSGSYAAHLLRIRPQYRDRRDRLLAALHRYFGLVEISGEEGGLHVFWRLPPEFPDAATVEALARRVRVGVYTLANAGAHDDRNTRLSQRGLLLGYAALTPKQIEEGMARLAKAVEEALPRCAADPPAAAALPTLHDDSSPAGGRPSGNLAPHNLHQPALRGRRQFRALWRGHSSPQSHPDMPVITSIYRYPIKGLSAQPLTRVSLVAGRPFPADRIFALARPNAPIDLQAPKWAKKGLFVMLMLEEVLAQVKTHLDIDSMQFTVAQGNRPILRVNLDDADDCARVEEYFHRLVPTLRSAPRLVRSPGGHFMDKPDNVLSLINLATVKSLAEQWGVDINPLRFRANFYIDGARPWEEFEWIGSTLRMGGATFRVDRRNGRCGATNVNPDTGRRDLDIPGSLRAAFGHKDLGVYLMTTEGGTVAAGDTVEIPSVDGGIELPVAARPAANGHRRFMCRGCYYIYEEAEGLPQQNIPAGTMFADIPSGWHCPDCGTDKGTFRPYVDPTHKTAVPTRP
jgi:GntR family transcriptional regulator / MocR family aminotransferase